MPYGDEFIGVFRGEQTNGIPYIYLWEEARMAIHWDFDEKEKIPVRRRRRENRSCPDYAYDPRLVKVEDTYYIIWCQDFYGAAIGMAKTTDFEDLRTRCGESVPSILTEMRYLFPRKINGNFVMLLSRPSKRQRPHTVR